MSARPRTKTPVESSGRSRRKGSSGNTSKKRAYYTSTSAGRPKGIGHWGDIKTKEGGWRFGKYLMNLKDASPFLRKEGGIRFWKALSDNQKRKIRKRLKEVDPAGLKEIDKRARRETFRIKRRKKFVAPIIDPKKDEVALREEVNGVAGVDMIRFMDMRGLKFILATALAAGYKREEVAAMTKMEVEDLSSLVTREDVAQAKRELPAAIPLMADDVVARDLIKGFVDENTERADRIAARRRKVMLEAQAEGRYQRSESRDLQEEREKHLVRRFGADRKSGRVIDVGSEED